MIAKIASAVIGILLLAFLALLVWGGLRGPTAPADGADKSQPAATLSEQLSEGLIEAQIFMTGNLGYRIDIQFSPETSSTIPSISRPDVNLAMVDMHMDWYTLPLEMVGAGAWQSRGKMPMAGLWAISIGFGDEFAETTFTAR